MLVRLSRSIHLLGVHFSRFDMLTSKRPGHRSWWVDDPWSSYRSGKCYQTDKRWATNSREWNRRLCRNLIMGKMLFMVDDPKTETVLPSRMRHGAQGLDTFRSFLPILAHQYNEYRWIDICLVYFSLKRRAGSNGNTA